HIPYKGFQGGHVTCGGIVYQGGGLGPKRENQYIAGNLLSSVVNWHELARQGSSFTATHGGTALNPRDPWFRPIDLMVGPDAGIFVVDWYDKRATHLDPIDNWDKTNGRIYRLHLPGAAPAQRFDLDRETDEKLVNFLKHHTIWHRREARRLLTERKALGQASALKSIARGSQSQAALEAFWALNGVGGLDRGAILEFLESPHPSVRLWAMRLACDPGHADREVVSAIARLLEKETSPMVRAQGACSARRLPPDDCLELLTRLACHSEDKEDPQIPLLVWWALEECAGKDPAKVARWASLPELWARPMFTRHLAERLARRLAAENSQTDNAALASLWIATPEAERPVLIAGMAKALAGIA
ncbi:MAG: hypothetical protein ACKOS8_00025, partial [Gemmataceae bacterium]